ncbi:unnamed protein product [Ceutorhynchus assimilis]|uniref:SOS1/NGEF-like PH domain-containing protein n=1 Tax=Ceutorhynchus assimilis TaxID=467358 RepID=A0A9P0GSH0_9CUCU|nr:unnamed protein product [Ceutorhynchus assimilis]
MYGNESGNFANQRTMKTLISDEKKKPMPLPRSKSLTEAAILSEEFSKNNIETLRKNLVDLMDLHINKIETNGFMQKLNYNIDEVENGSSKFDSDSDEFSIYEEVSISEDDFCDESKEKPPKLPPRVAKSKCSIEDYGTLSASTSNDYSPGFYSTRSEYESPYYITGPTKILDKAEISLRVTNIIDHLKSTEKKHLQELKDVIPVFKYAIKHHTALIIKNNAEKICSTTETLLKTQSEFEANLDKVDSLEMTLKGFINYEILFESYKQFFMEDCSEIVLTIEDAKNQFKTEILLGAILNQRLVHYKMFLEEIRQELVEDPELLRAVSQPLDVVKEILLSCNKKLVLEKITNNPWRTDKYGSLFDSREVSSAFLVHSCPVDVRGYGDYLLKDHFKITKPFKMMLTVFLFKNIIFLTKENQKDTFYYQGHLKTNEIIPLPEGKKKKVLKFHHVARSKQHGHYVVYKFEALYKETPEIWRKKIEAILWELNVKFRQEAQLKLRDSTKIFEE